MDGGLLSLKWNNHRSSFIHVLSSLRKKNLYADVTIACGGKFYPTHKLVLSTCSEYFQEMFQQTQCKHPIIVLKDILCEELESLLNYMYLGEVNVIQEKLSSLIKSAECLKIKGLAVPDDPPQKEGSVEKRSIHHNSSSYSKRRRSDDDSNNHEYKLKNKKNSNINETNHFSEENFSASEPFPPLIDNENITDNLPTENSSQNCKVKLEPIDIIEVEDSKEGILPNYSAAYSNNQPNKQSSVKSTKIIWDPQKDQVTDYPANEDNALANTEISQNDEVWREATWSEKQWFKTEAESDSTAWSPEGIQSIDDNSDGLQEFCDTSSSISKPQSQKSSIHLVRNLKALTVVYPCHVCEKVFDHKGNFRKHLMTHTGERPFKCNVCDYSSTQKGNLQTHMNRHHPALSFDIGL